MELLKLGMLAVVKVVCSAMVGSAMVVVDTAPTPQRGFCDR